MGEWERGVGGEGKFRIPESIFKMGFRRDAINRVCTCNETVTMRDLSRGYGVGSRITVDEKLFRFTVHHQKANPNDRDNSELISPRIQVA